MPSITEIDGVVDAGALAADEEALFISEFNNIALAGNNIWLEMLQLATEVYGPDRADFLSHDPLVWENPSGNNTGAKVAIAPQTRGWQPVAASELGMASEEKSNPLKYSFVGGQYQAIDTSESVPITGDYAEANALVLTGLVHDAVSNTDKRTLALVIRGTDQVADAYFDYKDFQSHYAKFAPLVEALHNYLADPASGIQQILISGHSLGAGVVPYFLQCFPDTASCTVRAYVDGPPGSEVDAGDPRIVNFVHDGMIFPAEDDHRGDAVAIVGEVSHSNYSNIGGGLAGRLFVEGIMDLLSPSGIDPKTRGGSDVLIDSDVPQDLPIVSWVYGQGLFGPQHNSNLYAADLAKLVRFADDDNSPFAWTDASKTQHSALASALRSGAVYEGPSVAIAIGQPATTELQALLDPKTSSHTDTNFVDPAVYVGQAYAQNINVYWRDDYVLSEANGIIHWDQPWVWSLFDGYTFNPTEHIHVVDGGSTAAPSLVVLQGSSTDYRLTTKMTDLGLEADVKWVDSDSNEHLIGQLYRTGPVLFLPTTTSSSAVGADTRSAVEPQFMVHLDGSAVTVQTARAGQAALTVDPSFDYTDAGNDNLTIIGSGLGDIIALGRGNNTITEITGNNIIFVKDGSTAGSNTIYAGNGYNTIVGGQGNDTIVGGSGITTVYYSGARAEYQISRLESGALQIADPGIGTPEGTDILSGVQFFSFADKTYSFSAPVIVTLNATGVYGQIFAADALFAAADSDGDIVSYQLYDSTPDPTSGKWLLGEAPQTPSQIIDVSAAQLAQAAFQSGFGTDSLSVRAFDGIDWSDWIPFTVAAPINPTSLLIGVNLAGAEFAPPYDTVTGQRTSSPNPGVFGTDYTYPTHVEIDYYAAKGMSVIRLPFLWERIQPTQLGSLDAAELARIDDVVTYATGKGLKIEIEPHDYGFGFGSLIGSALTPNSSFADLWGKLAVHYKSNPDVIFGLMNEPHEQAAAVWLDSANAAIAAIRSAGAMQEILVPGSYWDGGWTWTTTDNATVFGTGVQDPAHNFAFEVHQYLDHDGSGTHGGVDNNDPNLGVERLTAITQWAEANSQRLFLGEVGVDTGAISLEALDKMLSYIKQHTAVWSGVTYWAGGPWWGPYMFSIEPQHVNDPHDYGDKPQMAILERHLAGPAGDYNGTPGVDLFSATGDLLQAYGNDGNDQLDLTGNQNLLSGGDGNDMLRADGAGNDLYGDGGNDSLTALGSSNRLFGGTGNDAYFVDNTGDGAIESVGGGIDTVYATTHYRLMPNVENLVLQGSADLQGYGNTETNVIYGNSGNNLIDGGVGPDTMYGGAGNDNYFVDDAGDLVVEYANEGTDTVYSTAHLRLSANVENLILQGSADLQGYGNSLSNSIYGNSGNNLLDGGAGGNSMYGGTGNDVYYVDNIADVIVENANEGTDTVFSTANLVLGANVEQLVLQGSADLQGYGNSLANAIYGNSGNNVLDGGGGADALTGNSGNDTFVFHAGEGNGDTVIDFAGNGVAAGDSFLFMGYGTAGQGATFAQIGATNQWQIHSGVDAHNEIITLTNSASVHPTDYSFI